MTSVVALFPPTADPAGHVLLQVVDDATYADAALQRRITRVATLDGGNAFTYGGFVDSDATLKITWQPTDQATEETIRRLFRLYEQLCVATRGGVFLTAPQSLEHGFPESTMVLLVVQRLTE